MSVFTGPVQNEFGRTFSCVSEAERCRHDERHERNEKENRHQRTEEFPPFLNGDFSVIQKNHERSEAEPEHICDAVAELVGEN